MSDMKMRDPAQATPGMAQDPSSQRRAFQFSGKSDDSLSGLIHQLAEQGSHLAEQQVKLVEAEVRSGISDIKASAGALAGAAVMGMAGLGVTLMGLSFLLAEVMPTWLATMIVGLGTLAISYAMFAAGQKKLQSSALGVERTTKTLKRAPSAISGHSEEDRRRGQ